jgi:hypothetical protein
METGNELAHSFGIENTMEMGAGDQQLLNDLLAPETSTTDPDKLEAIVEEVEAPPKKGEKAKEVKKEEEELDVKPNIIDSFLNDGEEEEEEEIETPEKTPEKKVTGEEEEEEDDTVSKLTALSKDLVKLGVFTSDDEEEDINIKSPEEFLERFNVEKKKGAMALVDNFIGQFGEDYQQAFDAIFVKGVNPKDYFNTYNDLVDFSNLDLSVESNQERVVKAALTEQGFDPEDVETEVERLKNYGDLEAVATKYNKVIVKKQAIKLKEKEEAAVQEQQRKAAFKNQYIQNVQSVLQEKVKAKEFDGIPINPRLANELQDFLLVDKYKTASGETLTDFDRTILELKKPENHPMKVKLGLLLKILEKDPNLSTIQKSGVTKKSNELFGEVARQVTKVKKGDNRQETNKTKSWFS